MTEIYETRPCYPVAGSDPEAGYQRLAEKLRPHTVVAVDGSPAVDWTAFVDGLLENARRRGMEVRHVDLRACFQPWERLVELTSESTIPGDPHLSRLFEGEIANLLTIPELDPPRDGETIVVAGPGAAAVPGSDELWYVDLAKRHGLARLDDAACVLGRESDQRPDFRRMVFIDWPAIDRHRERLVGRIDYLIDLIEPERPVLIDGDTMRATIRDLSRRPFRTVPHFMPGAWGGHWMQDTFHVHPDEVNLAWSYEMIAPEAGVLVGDASNAVEIPLDMILAESADEVMGDDVTSRFGASFPIRFDYLDTMGGENLSVHCHPLPDYMRDVFGWQYTQHESYYLLDASPDSFVYLGLREDADVGEFAVEAGRAESERVPFEIKDHINTFSAKRHDYFMIPAGTPHGSSAGNVVLEISATPYFYSLRFYDYLRTGLDGKPRPIHLDHAFANLVTKRRGSDVEALIGDAVTVRCGPDWREEMLGGRDDLFFEVRRSHFDTTIDHDTEGRFHLVTLVEGALVLIMSGSSSHPLRYGETVLIPAVVGKYTLVNESDDGSPAIVVKARVSPGK